jgi:hypothetical protein
MERVAWLDMQLRMLTVMRGVDVARLMAHERAWLHGGADLRIMVRRCPPRRTPRGSRSSAAPAAQRRARCACARSRAGGLGQWAGAAAVRVLLPALPVTALATPTNYQANCTEYRFLLTATAVAAPC